jgi:hypothetical protein
MKTKNELRYELREELYKILDEISSFDDSEDLSYILKEKGWNVISEIDIKEDIRDFSTTVDFETTFEVEKNNEKFIVYISGEGAANISYDRWIDTDFYRIENIDLYYID